jgi:hypothetical protein
MKLALWRGPALRFAVFLCVACGKGKTGSELQVNASAQASASVSATSAALPSTAFLDTPLGAAQAPDPTCRALRVEGDAKVGQAVLASGATLDGSEWVSLAKGASLTLKHSSSGRELAIAGPALFRACRRGREQVLLARGKVAVGSGMGSRPGAEVLVATPVAGVRYADADFTLTLDDKKLSIEVRAGQLEVDPVSPASKALKSPLKAKDKLVMPLGKPNAALLLASCKQVAEAAEAAARHVGDRNAPEPLGERAQAHVKARKAARVACTIAAAATGLVADPVASAGLWAEAARWEGLWESIPRRGQAQGPEK